MPDRKGRNYCQMWDIRDRFIYRFIDHICIYISNYPYIWITYIIYGYIMDMYGYPYIWINEWVDWQRGRNWVNDRWQRDIHIISNFIRVAYLCITCIERHAHMKFSMTGIQSFSLRRRKQKPDTEAEDRLTSQRRWGLLSSIVRRNSCLVMSGSWPDTIDSTQAYPGHRREQMFTAVPRQLQRQTMAKGMLTRKDHKTYNKQEK
jgi:hypothetical protein